MINSAKGQTENVARDTTLQELVNLKVSLARIQLSSTNLNSANLSRADLSYADLSYADLFSANLRGADLSNAKDWTDSQLSQAKLCKTRLPQDSHLNPDRDCKALGISTH
jgi:uncharacterized protein YjbI with pentapeptide repeats